MAVFGYTGAMHVTFILTIILILSLIFYFIFRSFKNNYGQMSDRADLLFKGTEGLIREKQALLENLDESVLTLDQMGRITYANQNLSLLFGLDQEKILGKEFESIEADLHKEFWVKAQNLVFFALMQNERAHQSFMIEGGSRRHLELIAIPTEGKTGAILIFRDRSHEQKMLDVGKDFIANASHELKTPITIIRGFAETLIEMEEVSEAIYHSILEKIIRNSERMEQVVKNLLTLADLENSQHMEQRECDIVSLVEECCHNILQLHPEVRVEYLFNLKEILFVCDSTLLELLIMNILKNGVKYSDKPAFIKIVVQVQDGEIAIDIKDRGHGIPEEELERIFDRFYTVDKTHSRKLGGAGLGLSIAKTIVQKHEGKIWATSIMGKGTTFHIRFYL